MKRAYIILLVAVISSCEVLYSERGNGIRETEVYEVDDFDRIDISGFFDVVLERGPEPLVTITADENLFEFIRVRSLGGELEISSEKTLMSEDGIRIIVVYSQLEEIISSGASNIVAEEAIATERLRLMVSGAGKTELNVECEEVDVDMSGAGLIHLSGQTEDLTVYMSGAGSLEAFELQSIDCELSISGVGTAYVNVEGDLDASVSGVGGVEYIGNPKHITQDVSGVGSIKEGKNY